MLIITLMSILITGFPIVNSEGSLKCQYQPSGPNSVATTCPARYFCTNISTAILCPAGYYCPSGSCNPIPCECGHKCPPGGMAQIACQPPYYCPGIKNVNQTLCPIGFKCDQSAMCTPAPCAPGTYVSCAGKRSCLCCSPGRYCPTATTSLICPTGTFCPPCSSAPIPCLDDFACPYGSSSPKPTCVSNFTRRFGSKQVSPDLELSNGPQLLALVYGTIELFNVTHFNQSIWCLDFDQPFNVSQVYTASPVYTYEYVLDHPSVAEFITQTSRLNQIAFLLNTIVLGPNGTIATPSTQVWQENQTVSGCDAITTPDMQATFWAMVQPPGECDDSTGLAS